MSKIETIKLGSLGVVDCVSPASFSVVSDLCAEWNENASRAKMARLCAAAIGVCWDHKNNEKNPPLYDIKTCDPIAYGGVVLDWLYKQNAPMSAVYESGGQIMSKLFQSIPTEKEVIEAENFIESESEKRIA